MGGKGREVSIASHSGGGWEDRWMENRTRNKVHVRINGAYMLYDSKWGRPRRRAVLKQNICVRISMLRRSGPLAATCFPPQAGQKTTRILHTYASKGRVDSTTRDGEDQNLRLCLHGYPLPHSGLDATPRATQARSETVPTNPSALSFEF